MALRSDLPQLDFFQVLDKEGKGAVAVGIENWKAEEVFRFCGLPGSDCDQLQTGIREFLMRGELLDGGAQDCLIESVLGVFCFQEFFEAAVCFGADQGNGLMRWSGDCRRGLIEPKLPFL